MVWWGSYLASNIVRILNSRVPQIQGNMLFAVAQLVLGCLSAVMVVVVVRSIHRLQLRKAAVH